MMNLMLMMETILTMTSMRRLSEQKTLRQSKSDENEWRTSYPFLCNVAQNKHRAYCRCVREFGIGHSSECDVKTHTVSESHKLAERVSKQCNLLTKFMTSFKNVSVQNEVAAAEKKPWHIILCIMAILTVRWIVR